jgi:Electron transfer DM13
MKRSIGLIEKMRKEFMHSRTSAQVLALGLALVANIVMAQSGTILVTGTFHGVAHATSGRATVYSAPNGANTLRLTHFRTSNGPNLHVILIAATDAQDNDDFLKKGVDRVELGALKGNEGDQNYAIPANTDLSKYKAVSIFCERYNANFGTAPLEK